MNAPDSLSLLAYAIPMKGEQTFTIKAAAEACGVSESTIRRKRFDLRKYGAIETKNGWQIPASALLAVGLPLDTVTAFDKADSPAQGEIGALREQIALLERLLATEQRRVDYLQEQLAQVTTVTRELLPRPTVKRTLWQRLTGRATVPPETGSSLVP